jgi:hypothetical protein
LLASSRLVFDVMLKAVPTVGLINASTAKKFTEPMKPLIHLTN